MKLTNTSDHTMAMIQAALDGLYHANAHADPKHVSQTFSAFKSTLVAVVEIELFVQGEFSSDSDMSPREWAERFLDQGFNWDFTSAADFIAQANSFAEAIELRAAEANENEERMKVERRIARRIVRTILDAGYAVSIENDGVLDLEATLNTQAIFNMLGACDMQTIQIHDCKDGVIGRVLGWVMLVWGNGDDIISDWCRVPAEVAESLEEVCVG